MLNLKTRALKGQFADAWNDTAGRTLSGNIPHLLSLLDYPSVILSVPNFKIDPHWDPMDSNYQPLETNPYDNTNDELVKSKTNHTPPGCFV